MSNEKNLQLFDKKILTFKEKFYILMHLLVSNQGTSRLECAIFLGLFYLQVIAGFFSSQIGILSPKTSGFDELLNYIEKVVRVKGLLKTDISSIQAFIILMLIISVFVIIFFILLVLLTTKKSFYSSKEILMNFLIKLYIYIGFNAIIDVSLINFCFQTNNPYISEAKCGFSSNPKILSLSIILIIMSLCIMFFLQIYNNDNLFLFNSTYSKISCGYEIYFTFNIIIYSIFLNQTEIFSPYVFLIYNILVSFLLCFFFFKVYLYYDYMANSIAGIFHILYVWESVFFMIMKLIQIDNVGILFTVSSFFIVWLFFVVKGMQEKKILYKTPFNKIKNKYHLQFYIKTLIDKINLASEEDEEKALLIGILQMHIVECPNEKCLSKSNEKIYLPRTNEWSLRDKPLINDKIFLANFIIVILNFFLKQNYASPDIIINISLYYLKIIGNVCQSIFFCKKVKEMKMSLSEAFSYKRLKLIISKTLVEKLKSENEVCFQLEDLNTSLFFQYDKISSKFIEEMENDLKYTSMFWETLKNGKTNSLNFNEIFQLTDKIRITKIKVEKLFNNLFSIFNGVNDLFDLYLSYVETINDDDIMKRDLENIKRKNDNNTTDILHLNYYNFLFNKETGIIIINGDKGKEGIIEKTNKAITEIFGYDKEELKGLNVSSLMPKSIERKHKSFIERYFEIGEKKIIDKKDFKSFAKDKENNVFSIKLMVKIFPILNENVHFVALIIKEKIDDIILTDGLFNIEGMSNRIFNKLNIYTKNLFIDYEIPFYVICHNFLGFYKNFIHTKKKIIINIEKRKKNSHTKTQSNNQLINTSTPNNMLETHLGHQPQHTIGIGNDGQGGIKSSIFPPPLGLKQLNNNAENYQANNNIGDTVGETLKGTSQIGMTNYSLLINNPLNHINTINMNNNNLEVNETSELEYEIQIPTFLATFISFLSTIKKPSTDTFNGTNLIENNSLIEEETINEDNVDSTGVGEEKANLLKTPEAKTPTRKPNTNKSDNSSMTGTPVINVPSPRKTKEQAINNRLPEEEVEFLQQLNQHKILFYKGNFDELENLLKSDLPDSPYRDGFKFNFTFDRYKFGEKSQAYIIRCLENKNDFDGSDDSGDSIEKNNLEQNKGFLQSEFTHMLKKKKNESLLTLHEILEEEKAQLIEMQKEFLKLSIEDSSFRQLLQKNQDDIFKLSHIHGVKKQENLLEDENSSQSSQIGYNEDLSKKKRIEEIRGNALKNVSNFYMLNYYRLIIFFVFIVTIAFIIIFLLLFNKIYKEVEEISDINNKLFLTSNWFAFLISSVMSLKTLFLISTKGYNIQYYSFISDKEEYVKRMRLDSIKWINKMADNIAIVEKYIEQYIEDTNSCFWERETFGLDEVQEESFPIYFAKILSNANSLLGNEKFIEIASTKQISLSNIEIYIINYSGFISVINAYLTLFPAFIEKLEEFPGLFKRYIFSSLDNTIKVIIIYSAVLFIFVSGYWLLTYFTNKNIGEGFEKVSKIKKEKIEETIKKIEGFNYLLKKYIELNYRYNSSIFYDSKSFNEYNKEGVDLAKFNSNIFNIDKTLRSGGSVDSSIVPQNVQINFSLTPNQNQNHELSANNNNNSQLKTILSSQNLNEVISNKKLRLLTKSYFHPLILIILIYCLVIPSYSLIKHMNTLVTEIIDIQSYFFSAIFIASEKLIGMKLIMSNCFDYQFNIDYRGTDFELNNSIKKKQIISIIPKFPEIFDLYSKMRVSICDVIYQSNSDNLTECLKDPIVKNVNNTNSILENIPYRINLLYNLYLMNKNKTTNYNPFNLYEDENFKEVENMVYNYLTPLSDELANVTEASLKALVNGTKIITYILTTLLILGLIGFSIFIWIGFLNKIVHLLSVSRCVLTIIPIVVINSTPELENWIENKY